MCRSGGTPISSASPRRVAAASWSPRTNGGRQVGPAAEQGCEAGGERDSGDGLGDPHQHDCLYRQLTRRPRDLLIQSPSKKGEVYVKRLALLGSLAALVCLVSVAAGTSEPPPWAANPHGLVKPHGQ